MILERPCSSNKEMMMSICIRIFAFLNVFFSFCQEFLDDDRGGERDTLTTLLMLALIILPLVALIIVFGTEIKDKATEVWNTVFGTTV